MSGRQGGPTCGPRAAGVEDAAVLSRTAEVAQRVWQRRTACRAGALAERPRGEAVWVGRRLRADLHRRLGPRRRAPQQGRNKEGERRGGGHPRGQHGADALAMAGDPRMDVRGRSGSIVEELSGSELPRRLERHQAPACVL
jgi:hypothetical protein